MIRVLQIVTYMGRGGLETMIKKNKETLCPHRLI